MDVLLLRLAGPMQSWGVQSRFSMRDTGLEPSKSGVVGLLCAALGRPRSAALDDITTLRMGVRADAEGRLTYDFHTAQNVRLASGAGLKNTDVSRRYYLADAAFLVGLAGTDPALLEQLHAALAQPVWPLYLGRKSFVPAHPVWLADGLRRDADLMDALAAYPMTPTARRSTPARLRLILEDVAGSEVRPDQPISFAARTFGLRRTRTDYIPAPVAELNAEVQE